MTDKSTTETPTKAPPSPAEIKKAVSTSARARLPLMIITILILAAIIAALVWWKMPREAEIRYTTRPIERGDIIVSATATGTLEPRRTVSIGAEISGRIETVEVENNQTVTAGQTLATFDISTIKSALELQNANLAGMDASVRRAIAIYDQAKSDEARTLTLVDRGIVSRAEAEVAISSVIRAKADLDAARSNVARARASVTDVKTQLDKTVIVSPIDGVVLSRKVEPGQTVASSLQAPELFVLAEDLSRMKLNVWVDEADVGLVKAGQSATFNVSAWPGKTFEATVETLDLSPTKTDNVVTYTAVLSVENAEALLRPGMTANATIITGQQTDVLRVPNAALRWQPPVAETKSGSPLVPTMRMGGRRGGGGSTSGFGTVHVLKDGIPTAIRVQTGRTDGRFTEVSGDEITLGTEVIIGQTTADQPADQLPAEQPANRRPNAGAPAEPNAEQPARPARPARPQPASADSSGGA